MPAKTVSLTLPNSFQVQQDDIERRRKLVEALQQQANTPMQGQFTPGGTYVAPHATQYLAQLAQALVSDRESKALDSREDQLAKEMQQSRASSLQEFARAMRGQEATPDQMGESDGDGFKVTPGQPAIPLDRDAAIRALMNAQDQSLQNAGVQMLLKDQESDNVVLGRSLVNRNTGKVIGTDSTWQEEQKALREQRATDLQAKLEDQRTSREERAALQRELAQMRIDAAREQARLVAGLRQSSDPYLTPVQTGEGVMAFNHRTGKMEPVLVNGKTVVGSSSDPKLQGQIAGAKQTSEAIAKRDFNMGGVTDIMDRAESILNGKQKPTASVMGNVIDKAAGVFGASPAGAAEADELKVLGGYLVSKMPRMEGPQSNFDVQNYKEMAGDVGNPNLPLERRLASLKQLRGIVSKYDKSAAPISAAGMPSMSAIEAEIARRKASGGK